MPGCRRAPTQMASPSCNLVSAFPSPERERAVSLVRHAHEMFPYAHVVSVLCPGITAHPVHDGENAGRTERTARSLVQAMQMCTASLGLSQCTAAWPSRHDNPIGNADHPHVADVRHFA
ncbi:MAG: hypothetical protein JWM63_2125 [Gammaproteobacteria bacterium]|jgi:hypothetical protein|nr:hypothetical protein [Gammaproteobacteria bacterium]